MMSKPVCDFLFRPVSTAKTIAMAGQDPSLQLDRKGEGTADHPVPTLSGNTRRSIKSRTPLNNSGMTNTYCRPSETENWRTMNKHFTF